MKKILALMLSLVMILSLCACGNTSAGDNGDAVQNDPADNVGSVEGEGTAENNGEQETGYVGTWKVIPPDDNPFPPLYLVLNEDGTAGWGAKLDNLSPRIWYECEEDDAKEGQMELSREDNKGYGDDFYLTEDGTIYMETNLTVGENSYDHIYFERQ